MRKPKAVYYDVDLFSLSYAYLVGKGKPFNIADVMTVAEKILQKSEETNQYQTSARFKFVNNSLEVYSQDLIKLLE